MHRKLKESPGRATHTHVEPANRFPSTTNRWLGCSELTRLHGWDRATTSNSVRTQHDDVSASSPSWWKMARTRLAVDTQGVTNVEKAFVLHWSVDCSSTSDYGRGHSHNLSHFVLDRDRRLDHRWHALSVWHRPDSTSKGWAWRIQSIRGWTMRISLFIISVELICIDNKIDLNFLFQMWIWSISKETVLWRQF